MDCVSCVSTYMWLCYDLAQTDFLYGQHPLSSGETASGCFKQLCPSVDLLV